MSAYPPPHPLPLRVLIVIDSLGLGGAERLVTTFARNAGAAGMSVDIVCLANPDDPRSAMVGELRDIGIEPTFLSIPRLLSPKAIPKLVRAIRGSECDVVHAHLEYSCTLAPLAGRLARRPTVCTFHHVPEDWTARQAMRERLAVALAGHSQQVIFVSKAAMAGFAARYRPAGNWTVLPNGIDLDEFTPHPMDLPAELGIPGGSPVATIVAALRSGKGQDQAIAAWPTVLATVKGAMLLLVGSGDRDALLRAQAARLGVSDAVVFAGFRSDVTRLLGSSSLVLLPSAIEALPTTLIEAAACGRAVVASRVGGTEEVVIDGETGLLIEPGDVEGLARAVIELLGDDDRRVEMGRAARQRAEEHFNGHDWAVRLRGIYERAITAWPR